ncbi:hypothetical protein PF011_g25499 [Phytophthora fragariae]|uniref:RxLR effector protein n=1 Tax=Phytophthora fragariae TaxID=53985 RepID=A0A6A3HTS5_9STRA|nr:hypothetical protein PF011_g25499 [Phytophthora fragariae]
MLLHISCACFAAAVSARHPLFNRGTPHGFPTDRRRGFPEFRPKRSVSFKSLSINLVNRRRPPPTPPVLLFSRRSSPPPFCGKTFAAVAPTKQD